MRFGLTKKLSIPIFTGILILSHWGCQREEVEEIPTQNNLVIINTLSETVSIYDIEKDTLFEDVLETGKTPNDLLIQGDVGYIVNSGFGGIAALDIINLREMRLIERVLLPVGSNPYSIASSGDRFFITLSAKNQVLVLNKSLLPIDSIKVGKWPEGIASFKGKVYVAVTGFDTLNLNYGNGYTYIINTTSTPYSVDSVKVGKNPQMVKVFNNKIHIMCTGDYINTPGGFYVLNPETNTLEDSLTIDFNPQDFVYYKGKYYFVDFSRGIFSTSDGSQIDTLLIIHGASRIILDADRIWASIFNASDLNYIVMILPDSSSTYWIEAGQSKGVGPIGVYRRN
ncbi:MAG: hypothetical protein ABIM43_01275 [candidate division WOR-3 bacterium]